MFLERTIIYEIILFLGIPALSYVHIFCSIFTKNYKQEIHSAASSYVIL